VYLYVTSRIDEHIGTVEWRELIHLNKETIGLLDVGRPKEEWVKYKLPQCFQINIKIKLSSYRYRTWMRIFG